MKTIIIVGGLFLGLLHVSCQSNDTNDEKSAVVTNRGTANLTNEAHTLEKEELRLREGQLKAIDAHLGYLEKKNLQNGLQAIGFIRVHNQDKASVTSLYGGRVQAIYISPGMVVKKGQILASLANPQIISLQEELLTLMNNLELTKIELMRQEELVNGNAGALKNLQNVQSQSRQLEIRKAAIEKQLILAGINAGKLTTDNIRETISILAPIEGTVSQIAADIGSNASAGTVIANIVNNAEVDLDLYVYEKDIDKVKVGQEISFSLSNNPTKVGKAIVDKVGSSFEGENKSIAVHAHILSKGDGFIDGMGVNALLETGEKLVTAIPTDGIVDKDGTSYLFYIVGEQTDVHAEKEENLYIIKRARIKKGIEALGYIEVIPLDKIPDQAKVITSSATFLQAKLDGVNTHSH